MAAAGLVDPTKVGRYPVVLSDALLGKKQGDVYTAVRYNHKPDAPPEHAKLRQNTSKAYDLSYTEDGSKFFKYRGNRTSGDNKYVLIFDPRKEVFVLHLVDSTFNLNLIQTPDNKDADSLKREYPHLKNSDTKAPAGKAKGGAPSQSKPGKPPKEQAKPAAPPKRSTAASDDEESSDDDGGLDIEFPGGQESTSNRDFSPAFPPRRFSDFVAEADEEEDDADGEDDDDDMSEEHFKLPSPMNAQMMTARPTIPQAPVPQPLALDQSISLTFDPDSESEEDEEPAPPPQAQPEPEQDDDMQIDLERELEDELGAALGVQSDAESDVSEED